MPADPNAAQWEQQAAQGTGIPMSVTKAQAIAESGEGANLGPSSAGALGFWQFLPSTYNANAPAAGVPQNTEMNTADETKVYVVYMNQLLKQEGGSVFRALEAYNAGPGNLNAGAGYATGILNAAGQNQNLKAGTPGNISTASITIPGTGISIGNPLDPSTWINALLGGIEKGLLNAFGVKSFKDMFQRLGLILFGVVLIYVGIRILSQPKSGGGGGNNKNQGGGAQGKEETETKPPLSEGESQPSTEVLSPKGGEVTTGAGAAGTGVASSEALEMAAIA